MKHIFDFIPFKIPLVRIAIALLMMVPAISLLLFIQATPPNIEVWLTELTEGKFRPDAFEGLAKITPNFTVMFVGTSALAACLIVIYQGKYIPLLLVGPALGIVVYLMEFGFADPAFFTFAALLSVGMFVGSPVTAIWACVNHSRFQSRRARGATECA